MSRACVPIDPVDPRMRRRRGKAPQDRRVSRADGGRVHVNGAAVKPSRDVRPGDEIAVTMGQVRRTVVVRGTAVRRGPATEAQLLYEETPESIAERERHAQDRRLAAQAAPEPGGRPTKRDRRRLERTRRPRG